MRPWLRTRQSAFREHGERLRKSHAAAQTLRRVFPQATLAKVQLRFLPASTSPHATQSFRPEARHVDGTQVR